MSRLISSIRIFFIYTIALGIIYPLVVMLSGQLFFPKKANGSLITYHEKIVGSSLIAQEFHAPKYFHSRPSANNYNATKSGSSNLAASNPKLYEQIEKRVKQITLENELSPGAKLPPDMVFTSASGLDPHISFNNALLQLPRVAKYRNLSKETIKKLIYQYCGHKFIGIWGRNAVNVLQLNLALDKLEEKNTYANAN